jgi:membrane protease YdiL (CAAX protease family)
MGTELSHPRDSEKGWPDIGELPPSPRPPDLLAPPPPQPYTGLAAATVAVLVALALAAHGPAGADPTKGGELSQLVSMELVGRVAYALQLFEHPIAPKLASEFLVAQGPIRVRLCSIIALVALGQEQTAGSQLLQLRELLQEKTHLLSPVEAELLELVARRVEANDGRAVRYTPQEQQFLRQQLRWFGSLLVVHSEPQDEEQRQAVQWEALKTAWVLTSGVVLLGVLLIGGIFGSVWLLWRAVTGSESFRFSLSPVPPGFFLEAFALALVLNVSASLVFQGHSLAMILVPTFTLLGLVALSRSGMPLSQWWHEVGLHRGAGLVRESLAGVAAYAMLLPFLLGASVLVWALVQLAARFSGSESPFQAAPVPQHPLVAELIREGPAWEKGILLLGVMVVGPLVEEILFRGLLYRFLRGGTYRWGRIVSVLASAVANGLVFAALHPQGYLAIPALGTLGAWLCLVREWRSSLVACAVVHGLNNSLVAVVLTLAL